MSEKNFICKIDDSILEKCDHYRLIPNEDGRYTGKAEKIPYVPEKPKTNKEQLDSMISLVDKDIEANFGQKHYEQLKLWKAELQTLRLRYDKTTTKKQEAEIMNEYEYINTQYINIEEELLCQ